MRNISCSNPPLPPRSNLNVIIFRVVFLILINVVVAESITVLIKPDFRSLRSLERNIVDEFQHFMSRNGQQWLPAIAAVHPAFSLYDVVKCVCESVYRINHKRDEPLLLVALPQILLARALRLVAPINSTFVPLLPELVKPNVATIHIRLIVRTLIGRHLGFEWEKVAVEACRRDLCHSYRKLRRNVGALTRRFLPMGQDGNRVDGRKFLIPDGIWFRAPRVTGDPVKVTGSVRSNARPQ